MQRSAREMERKVARVVTDRWTLELCVRLLVEVPRLAVVRSFLLAVSLEMPPSADPADVAADVVEVVVGLEILVEATHALDHQECWAATYKVSRWLVKGK